MQITLTEGIILALITFAGTLVTGWYGFRGMLRKADQEATATDATARAELERLLMARIDQLQDHIAKLELRIAAKDDRIQELEHRVDELETENARLRAELARICGERSGGDALRGITGS